MPDSIQMVESITRIYKSNLLKGRGTKSKKSPSANRYIDEVDISIEGKKRQILENIVLEAIDELPNKTFEK